LQTLTTLSDLTEIPSNDTFTVYPDYSSECLGLWVQWISSLILLISFLKFNWALLNVERIKNFLSVIEWNE
ncbi:hypothetical protein PFISCL1PPCAC_2330, partial [Pristionchus fissidentatus]